MCVLPSVSLLLCGLCTFSILVIDNSGIHGYSSQAVGINGLASHVRHKREKRRKTQRTRRSHADIADVIRGDEAPRTDACTPRGDFFADGSRRAQSLRGHANAGTDRGKRTGKRKDKQRDFQTPVFSQECDNLLLEMHSWGLDHFSLETLASGRPLTALGELNEKGFWVDWPCVRMYVRMLWWWCGLLRASQRWRVHPIGMKIFEKTGLLTEFKISPLVLCQFFIRIEENYARYPDVPYHNNLHGTDVMHATYVLLMDPKMASSIRKIE